MLLEVKSEEQRASEVKSEERGVKKQSSAAEGKANSNAITAEENAGWTERIDKIGVKIEVVVVERRILFRIEHFEQRTRRVAVIAYGHLVHLVEDDDLRLDVERPCGDSDVVEFRRILHEAEFAGPARCG